MMGEIISVVPGMWLTRKCLFPSNNRNNVPYSEPDNCEADRACEHLLGQSEISWGRVGTSTHSIFLCSSVSPYGEFSQGGND